MTVISPDSFLFREPGHYDWTPERAAEAWIKAMAEFERCLERTQNQRPVLVIGIPGSGKSTWIRRELDVPRPSECPSFRYEVFFEANFCTRVARQPLLELAARHSVPLQAVVLQVPLITALRRNAGRPPERRVPAPVMQRRYEELREEPPTLAEGFWRLTGIDGSRGVE